jgi:hypothetical protein
VVPVAAAGGAADAGAAAVPPGKRAYNCSICKKPKTGEDHAACQVALDARRAVRAAKKAKASEDVDVVIREEDPVVGAPVAV